MEGSRSAAVTKQHLHETAATTLMGRLLRKFWQPVALASDVAVRQARPIRILGDDLTLYRDESGKNYLLGARCSNTRRPVPRADGYEVRGRDWR